jgi:hypothetical protein
MTYRDVSQLTGVPVEKLFTMEQPERDRLSQIIVRCLHLLRQQQQQQQQQHQQHQHQHQQHQLIQ